MPWLYNSASGDVEHQSAAEYAADAALNVAGWEHLTKLPLPDSATTAQAVSYVQAQQAAGKLKGQPPTTSAATANANASTYVAKTVPGGSAIVDVSNFLGRLAEGNTWIRVAEGLLGIILVAVGLARLTHAVPIATKIAGAVA